MPTLDYVAHPTLQELHRCDDFVRGIVGPIGSGKSHACVMELLLRSMHQEPDAGGRRRTRWAIIRSTYRELQDTTLQTFNAVIPSGMRRWRATDMSATLAFPLPDGTIVDSQILFRALDRPDDVSKLLSLELTGAWVNEARETPKGIVDMLQGRVGRYPPMRDGGPTWYGVLLDSNPCDTTDWWYKTFEEERPEGWSLFHQPGGLSADAENLENLPGGRDYYHRLMQAHSQDWIEIYVNGQYGFTIEGRPIYPEYIDKKHCIEEQYTVTDSPVEVGLDFGLTPAAIFAQKNAMGRYTVFDELVTENMGAVRFGEELGQMMREKYRGLPFQITGDPAGDQRSQVDERTVFDVLGAMNIPADPASTNDFVLRREAVVSLLSRLAMDGEPALRLVAQGVPMLRKGMLGGYCYRRMNIAGSTERYQEKPDKNIYSHVCEALQYMCVGSGLALEVIKSRIPERPTRVISRGRVVRQGARW